jgi:DNA mismatch repair protein MutS
VQSDRFQQYARLKSQGPGVILLLHTGDFYEVFDDDADTVARICTLAKTRCAEHRVARFPHTQLARFLTALLKIGFKVATVEPVADKPLPGKPVIIRGIPCAKKEETQ